MANAPTQYKEMPNKVVIRYFSDGVKNNSKRVESSSKH